MFLSIVQQIEHLIDHFSMVCMIVCHWCLGMSKKQSNRKLILSNFSHKKVVHFAPAKWPKRQNNARLWIPIYNFSLVVIHAQYHTAWVKHYALLNNHTQNLLSINGEASQVHILVVEVKMNRCGTSSNMHEIFNGL